MPAIRIKDAAVILGVSDDTVRRWIDSGSLAAFKDESGRKVIAGDVLAAFASDTRRAAARSRSASPVPPATDSSAWSRR